MLEVFVEYISNERSNNKLMADLVLSTESGDRAHVKYSEKGNSQEGFMTRCLSKYASGMYSKAKNKFVPECDVTEDMEGYEPYHLNYCPECVEREFECFVPGYRLGSLNSIYGGKVKAIVMDVMHYIDDDTFHAEISLYDDNDNYLDVYTAVCAKDADRNAFVLDTMKQMTTNFYYSVEDGYWDMYPEDMTPHGTFYGVDFDIDEDEVMDFDLTVDGE